MTSAVVFEDEGWRGFAPMTLTRHVSQQLLGSSSLLSHIQKLVGVPVTLCGRHYLAEMEQERTGLPYNEEVEGRVLAINGRARPAPELKKLAGRSDRFVVLDGEGAVVLASISKEDFVRAVEWDGVVSPRRLFSAKGVEKLRAPAPLLLRAPWELIETNEAVLAAAARRSTRGKRVSPDAEVEEPVYFDTRRGPITIEKGAHVEAFSRISGPTFIGERTVVHSARIGPGTTIGESCRIGGEVEHSIVQGFTNKAHFGFLGHSVVGEWVNLGAGSVTSDLKSTYGTIKVTRSGKRVDTGMVKLGATIGDMAKVASGTVIQGGRSVGISSLCSGVVGEDVPDFEHFDGTGKGGDFRLRLESVMETQSRMMLRRGAEMTPARRALIAHLYAATA